MSSATHAWRGGEVAQPARPLSTKSNASPRLITDFMPNVQHEPPEPAASNARIVAHRNGWLRSAPCCGWAWLGSSPRGFRVIGLGLRPWYAGADKQLDLLSREFRPFAFRDEAHTATDSIDLTPKRSSHALKQMTMVPAWRRNFVEQNCDFAVICPTHALHIDPRYIPWTTQL